MVSIVMTVYNGEKFLEEQFRSLAHQTLLPDELLIGDDGSTDGTEALIRRMEGRLPFPVFYKKNVTRLGYAENFRQTADRAQGELVFFCDQDDVWKRDKIQKMVFVMDAHPEILVLVSAFWLTDSKIRRMRLTMDQMLSGMTDLLRKFFRKMIGPGNAGKSSHCPNTERRQARPVGTAVPEKISWEQYLRHPRYPGMTMAIRRELWEEASGLCWPEKAAHDWMVCELAAEKEGLYRIPDRLVFYRQHGNNTTGTAADRSGSAAVQGRIRLLETMAEEAESLCVRDTLAPYERKIQADHVTMGQVSKTADGRRRGIARRTAVMLRGRIRILERSFSPVGLIQLFLFDLAHLDCMTIQSLCGDLVCFLRKRS